MERAAQKRDVTAYRLSARKTGNRLVDDGLKNGRGDIFAAGAFVDERLHVGFRKNAATRGNRVDRVRVFCKRIETVGVRFKESGHLIDKGSGTARARTVHALLDPAFKIRNLRIFAAEFDDDIGERDDRFDGSRRRDDFLNKRNGKPLRHGQSSRTGHFDGNRPLRSSRDIFFEEVESFVYDGYDRAADIGAVTFVVAVYERIVVVEHGDLYGRRADIDAYTDRKQFIM